MCSRYRSAARALSAARCSQGSAGCGWPASTQCCAMRAGSAARGSSHTAMRSCVCAAMAAGTLARTASNTRSWAKALPRITCADSSSLSASANCMAVACSTCSAIAMEKSAPAMLATRANASAAGDSCASRRSMRWPTDTGRGSSDVSASCASLRSTQACLSVSSTKSGLPPVRRASPGASTAPLMPGRPSESISAASAPLSSGRSTTGASRACSASASCSACTGEPTSAGR